MGDTAKGEQVRVATGGADSKHVAAVAHPAVRGRAVEIAVTALHQSGLWIGPSGAAGKGVEVGIVAGGADPKHRAVVDRPAETGQAVEIAIATLHQPGIWIVPIGGSAKGEQIGVAAGGADPKHRAKVVRSTAAARPIEIAVAAMHQPGRVGSIVGDAAKGVQIREAAGRTDPKDGAAVVCPTFKGCAVEIAVVTQHQPGGIGPIVGGSAKEVQIGEATGETDPKHGADLVRPAIGGRPVEIAVATLHHRGSWKVPIGVGKGVQVREAAGGADPKHGAITIRPAARGQAVEIAVVALHQRGTNWDGPIGAGKGVQIRLYLGVGIERPADPNHQHHDQRNAK